jgi:hypothetical protein
VIPHSAALEGRLGDNVGGEIGAVEDVLKVDKLGITVELDNEELNRANALGDGRSS